MVLSGSGPSGPSGSADDGFRPSHVVPAEGLPAWDAPDPGRPTVPLDPFLPVQLLERLGDWGRVLCSNGWSAWVDGRLLVSVPPDPPAAGRPMGTATDPRPLLARAEEAVTRYRAAAEELVAGHVDGEAFRRRTQGLRIGLVVDGESLWMYDARRERWLYCDGTRLTTYAASAGPSVAGTGPTGGGQPPPAAAPGGRGASATPGPRTGAVPAAPAGHEPTRVVEQPAVPDAEPTRVVEQPPEPTRVAEQPPEPDAEPTRVAEQPPVGDLEPTRVVEQPPAPEPTRVVAQPPDPEPTRVVEQPPDPEPTRVVERPPAEDDRAEGPPDRTGDG
ncbi:hypothetical protein ACPB9J_07470 [Streptomyces lavendulocolor]|uniref:hypothetical protein n=1 Tax=Streptomyces lavendulocolor TaxID=67316 RepID=UPI003C2ADC43